MLVVVMVQGSADGFVGAAQRGSPADQHRVATAGATRRVVADPTAWKATKTA